MDHTVKENRLQANLNLLKFPMNTEKEYELGQEQDWVRELLQELNEKAEDKPVEDYLKETSIELKLNIQKKFSNELGEYLLFNGNFQAKYVTQCVRTLKDMSDSIELDFKTCFIDTAHQDDEAHKDQLEIFIDNDLFDLYFYEKKTVNLKEMIHEQIYLNINQYPIKDTESSLDWANEPTSTKQ